METLCTQYDVTRKDEVRLRIINPIKPLLTTVLHEATSSSVWHERRNKKRFKRFSGVHVFQAAFSLFLEHTVYTRAV
jgi:hypothetical protein